MRVEYFSGVRVIGWCVMSNHVHVYIYLDEGRYHHRESPPTTEAMSAVAAYEEAIRQRIGVIEEDEKAGRVCDSIFGRLAKGGVGTCDNKESTHAVGVAPLEAPEKWTVQFPNWISHCADGMCG